MTPTELAPGVVTEDPDAPKWAIRLEAKVDLALGAQRAEIIAVQADARDAQKLAANAHKLASEANTALVQRPTWRALWAVAGGLGGGLLGFLTFVQPYLDFTKH